MQKTYTEWRSADRLGRWAEARKPLVVDRIGRDDLVSSTYSVARGLSRWPYRQVPDGLVRSTDGIGTIGPRTSVTLRAKKNYALCAELGQRAYDALYGREAKRPKAKASKAAAKVLVHKVLAEAKGVVTVDSDLAKALGIMDIGYLE